MIVQNKIAGISLHEHRKICPDTISSEKFLNMNIFNYKICIFA